MFADSKVMLNPDKAREVAQKLWDIKTGTGFSVAQLSRAAQVNPDSLNCLLDLKPGKPYAMSSAVASRLNRLFKAWDSRESV